MHQKAPFNKSQIQALNEYQNSGIFHPYTCPSCSRALIPSYVGLRCFHCKYIQNWAINWTTNLESVDELREKMKGGILVKPNSIGGNSNTTLE